MHIDKRIAVLRERVKPMNRYHAFIPDLKRAARTVDPAPLFQIRRKKVNLIRDGDVIRRPAGNAAVSPQARPDGVERPRGEMTANRMLLFGGTADAFCM